MGFGCVAVAIYTAAIIIAVLEQFPFALCVMIALYEFLLLLT